MAVIMNDNVKKALVQGLKENGMLVVGENGKDYLRANGMRICKDPFSVTARYNGSDICELISAADLPEGADEIVLEFSNFIMLPFEMDT